MGKCQLPCWKWLNFDLPELLSFLGVLCHHMSIALSWGLNSPSACVLNFPILHGFGLCSLRAWQLLFSFELSWNHRAWFQNPSHGSQAAKTLVGMLHCHLQQCSPTPPLTPLLALQQLSSKPGDRIRHRHKQLFFFFHMDMACSQAIFLTSRELAAAPRRETEHLSEEKVGG